MRKVPFVDLTLPAEIESEIDSAIQAVVRSKQFVLGEAVEAFEDAFSGYCEAKYAIGVSSGTAALHLALLASGVGAGAKVVTAPNTFVATAEAILYTGAGAQFVDVYADTANMDSSKLADAITLETRAIIPVHLYGQMADMRTILDIATRNNLSVIEDACQAHGAAYADANRSAVCRPGDSSDAACFSFYPSKNLGCYGDGGAVVTNSKKVYERICMMRNHGQRSKGNHAILGYNYRLDAIQAAVLSVKLKHLNAWNARRQEIAALYGEMLPSEVTPIQTSSWTHYHSRHLYVIAVESKEIRGKLKNYLGQNGISTGIHYPVPIHLQPAYKSLGYQSGDFPVAESLSGRILSLPMYPELAIAETQYVCSCIKAFYNGGANE